MTAFVHASAGRRRLGREPDVQPGVDPPARLVPASPLPIAGLVRAPGPAESSGRLRPVVRRATKLRVETKTAGGAKKKKAKPKVVLKTKKWADLDSTITVNKAPWVIRRVIRFYAESATEHLEYSNLKDLVEVAKEQAKDLPDEFFESVDNLDDLQRVATDLGKKPYRSADTDRQTERRRRQLAKAHAGDLTTFGDTLLHSPVNPTGYHLPDKASKATATLDKRADAEFNKVENPYPGAAGKSTSAANVDLLTKGFADGSLMQIGDVHLQICPFCNHLLDARLFEVDHQQPWAEIRERFRHLAQAMAVDDVLLDRIRREAGTAFKKYFQVTEPTKKVKNGIREVALTQACMNMFSNDMGNLVRVCRVCNAFLKKDDSAAQWYETLPLFGTDFVEQAFPSGTHVLTRVGGKGLGVLVLEWFDRHILPVMKRQEVTARLAATHHASLTDEAALGLQAWHATDTAHQKNLAGQQQRKRLHNTALEGATDVQNTYFSGTPSPWAPNSPERYKKAKLQVDSDREERKTGERLAVPKIYDETRRLVQDGVVGLDRDGLTDAELVAAVGTVGITVGPGEELASALAAYRQGRRDFQDQHRLGADQAMSRPRGAPGPVSATAGFRRGFAEAAAARAWAFDKGGVDGRIGRMDIGPVFALPFAGQVLAADYEEGFNAARVS